jgi:hypothetical protein
MVNSWLVEFNQDLSTAKMPIEILEDTVVYGAKTKLLELAVETAEIRNLTKLEAKAKINKGFKIFLWLQALDYEFLTKDQRDQILYCLVDLADVNDLPVGPTLGNTTTTIKLVRFTRTITLTSEQKQLTLSQSEVLMVLYGTTQQGTVVINAQV